MKADKKKQYFMCVRTNCEMRIKNTNELAQIVFVSSNFIIHN